MLAGSCVVSIEGVSVVSSVSHYLMLFINLPY